MSRGLALALAGSLACSAPAAAGAERPAPYRNPTLGSALALQTPGMHKAKVMRNVVYRTVAGTRLRVDV
jgi:hypothetical protein